MGYAELSALNPRLVYCSITGYGQTGPYANRPGYDPIAQALSGMMSVTGERDELPGGGPQRPGVSIVDILTGVYGALAIVSALYHRNQSGRGQHIDLALLDVAMASMTNVAQAYLGAGVIGRRFGSGHPTVVPSQIFRAADGYVMMTAGNDAQFERFCEVAERRELLSDPRFVSNDTRVRNRESVVPVVAGIIAMKPCAFWVETLGKHGIPCAPINNIAQAFEDPHLKHRGARVDLPDSMFGKVSVVANPIHFSETTVTYSYPPPRLGEHTEQVLSEWLGLTPADVQKLRECGAV
jgi:crotonobetainyl-CoA:carnitine CoA-transferase CaiB-like acyl-CoA transferase